MITKGPPGAPEQPASGTGGLRTTGRLAEQQRKHDARARGRARRTQAGACYGFLVSHDGVHLLGPGTSAGRSGLVLPILSGADGAHGPAADTTRSAEHPVLFARIETARERLAAARRAFSLGSFHHLL